MSRYVVIVKQEALADLKRLSTSEPKAFQKALAWDSSPHPLHVQG